MKLNIHNCTNVTVTGHRTSKNCKAVYCLDTGEIYASTLDAAEANDICQSSISGVLTGRLKTANGKRFCYVSRLMEHLEEINEINRTRMTKVAAYDADVERRNAIAKAQADVQKREEKVAELRRQLEEAESDLNLAKHDFLELKNHD